MTFPDQERAHIASMWAAHHDGRFETAALEALEAGDCVGARSAEGASVFASQALVYATLALVEQQRIANRLQVAELDLHEELAMGTVDLALNFRIRPYLTASDWASIKVPEGDEEVSR